MSFSRIDTRVGEYFLSIASPRAPCKQGQLRRKKLPQCVLCVVVGNGRPRRLKSGSRPRALLVSSFRRRTSIQPLALTTSQLSGKGAGASQPSGGGTRVRDALRSALFARESRQPKEQGQAAQGTGPHAPEGSNSPEAPPPPTPPRDCLVGSLTPRRGGEHGQALF